MTSCVSCAECQLPARFIVPAGVFCPVHALFYAIWLDVVPTRLPDPV